MIGGYGAAVPARLVRHGAHFDFMGVWGGREPSAAEWDGLVGVLRSEVEASRRLHALFWGRARWAPPFRMLHRPLVLA